MSNVWIKTDAGKDRLINLNLVSDMWVEGPWTQENQEQKWAVAVKIPNGLYSFDILRYFESKKDAKYVMETIGSIISSNKHGRDMVIVFNPNGYPYCV